MCVSFFGFVSFCKASLRLQLALTDLGLGMAWVSGWLATLTYQNLPFL